MDTSALKKAILEMERRKVHDEVTEVAKSGLDAAASVGAETPVIILKDIWRCIMEMGDVMRERGQTERERELRREERHVELISALQQMYSHSS